MKVGAITATGPPHHFITERSIRETFDRESVITTDPVSDTPLLAPIGTRRTEHTSSRPPSSGRLAAHPRSRRQQPSALRPPSDHGIVVT